MQHHIASLSKCLDDNNKIGMSATDEPIHWNLHNAIDSLAKTFEEEIRKLNEKVASLENQVRKIQQAQPH